MRTKGGGRTLEERTAGMATWRFRRQADPGRESGVGEGAEAGCTREMAGAVRESAVSETTTTNERDRAQTARAMTHLCSGDRSFHAGRPNLVMQRVRSCSCEPMSDPNGTHDKHSPGGRTTRLCCCRRWT